MRLLSCHIAGFGHFREKDVDFVPGVNCILEANGFGKTTLTDFLCAMFYGMDGYRAGAVSFVERMHYYPAAASGDCLFGGTVTFEKDGAEYRIERFFSEKSAAADRLTVYRDGTVTEELGDCPGVSVFGIDKESFTRTAFFRNGAVTPGATPDLNRALHGTVAAVGDGKTAEEAADRLKEAARKLQSRKKGTESVPNLQAELTDVSRRILQLRDTEKALDSLYRERRSLEETAERLRADRTAAANRLQAEGRLAVLKEKEKAAAEAEEKLRALDAAYPQGIPGREVTDLLRAAGNSAAAFGSAAEPGTPAAVFAGEIPAEEDYAENREKIRAFGEAERQKAAIDRQLQPQEAEYGRLKELFEGPCADFPSEEADRLSAGLRDCDEALRRGRTALREEERRKDTSFPFGLTLLCLSPAFLVAGILLRNTSAAIFGGSLALAAVCFAAGLLLLILPRCRRSRRIRELLSQLNGTERQKLQTETALRTLLSERGYDGEDPQQTYGAFRIDGKRWEALRAEREKLRTQQDALAERAAVLYGEIRDFLSFHGLRADGLPAAELLLLQDKAAEKYRVYQMYTEARGAAAACLARLGLSVPETGAETALAAGMDRDRTERSLLQSEAERKRSEAAAYQREAVPAEMPPEPVRTAEETDALLHGNAAELAALDRRIEEIEAETARIGEYEARERELRERIALLQHRIEVYSAAADAILAADGRITEKYIAPVRDRFEIYAERLGSIAGEHLSMDAFYRVKAERNGVLLDERYFSEGQKALCSLCLRLAMIDNIYIEEKPFLVFDDPFAGLDAVNMTRAAAVLRDVGKECQILYFCCHESRIIGKEE